MAAKGVARLGRGGRTGPLLVLVALALVLGFLVLKDGPSTDEARERARRLGPDFHAAHVQRFTLLREGVAWRFERRPGSEPEGGWWLVPPGKGQGRNYAHVGRADGAAVQELLATVEWAIVERRLGTTPPPDSGLEPPRLEFVGGGLRIVLGKDDPLGAGIYAQVEPAPEPAAAEAPGGSPLAGGRHARGEVVVTDPHLGQLLEGGTSRETLRETSLLAAPVRDAHVIEIRPGAGTATRPVRLERHGVRWDLMMPAPVRSDAARVEELLKTLADTRAVRFLADLPGEAQAGDVGGSEAAAGPRGGLEPSPAGGDRGRDPHRGAVVVIDGRVRAHVLGPCGQGERAVMRWDGAVACFADQALEPLFREPGALRELRPWPLPADEVASFTLRQGAGSLTLEHDHDGWQVRQGEGPFTPADEEAVHQWLAALAAVNGAPAPPDARPSGEPGFRAMARTTSGETLSLSVVGRSGGGLLVVRNNEEDPLVAGEALGALLDVAPRAFRPRRVLSLRESEVRRLIVDGAILERSGPSVTAVWRLAAPQHRPGMKPGGAIDTARLDRLLVRLGELRALRFVPRTASDAELLAHPTRRLHIETAGPPSIELRLAAPRTPSDGCPALLDDQPDAFLLPAEVCADLLAPLVGPDTGAP
ncbi:MAG TPA: hypothetical protein VH877_29105 [Polyangia bacterium]|nr:hypothetical protein [Polyangia bacterium]